MKKKKEGGSQEKIKWLKQVREKRNGEEDFCLRYRSVRYDLFILFHIDHNNVCSFQIKEENISAEYRCFINANSINVFLF